MSEPKRQNYLYSCDTPWDIKLKIGSLEEFEILHEGEILRSNDKRLASNDLTVSVHVAAGKRQLCIPTQTAYKPFSHTNQPRVNWQEWLTLPMSYSQLPRHAELVFQIHGLNKDGQRLLCGETATPIFDSFGCVKKGMEDLTVVPTLTSETVDVAVDNSTVQRLNQAKKRYDEGHMQKIDWLDRLAFAQISSINQTFRKESKMMYLSVEYPKVVLDEAVFDIIFFEVNGDDYHTIHNRRKQFAVSDANLNNTNLVEQKHHILARTLRTGTEKDLQPDLDTRNKLEEIAAYPCTQQLTSEEQDLIWKYRVFLATNKLALPKFLLVVSWESPSESHEAVEMMKKHEPILVEEALELLSPAYTEKRVRHYAVARLMHADDEEVLLYLAQLVQAVRYEDIERIRAGMMESAVTTGVLSQADLDEALEEDQVQSVYHQEGEGDMATSMDPDDPAEMDDVGFLRSTNELREPTGEMDIASFLIHRASTNFKLANYLYWYLKVEAEDNVENSPNGIYAVMLERFNRHIKKRSPHFHSKLLSQERFMTRLLLLIQHIATSKGDRKKKIEKLKNLLADPEPLGWKDFTFREFAPVPLPLDPDKLIKAILPDDAYLFKSALCPARLTLLTTTGEQYPVMFKNGDDLRQDQLVLQMIHLMDKLLRKENLDLKLTPYRVLATSSKHGFLQFVANSTAVAVIQDSDGTILNYLKKRAPGDTPSGISTSAMDNYTRSCAGYCVITYLLGVGDRHLDNLMLTPQGHLFHVDFGYILGRDPKPMPPPMRLTKEMVDAMGGVTGEHYKMFTDLCFSAFFHLRRSANLILNLFTLMVDANIPDIMLEPDKTVKKVQEKFLLNVTDEEAAKEMQNLLEVSVGSLMPAIAETFHRIAQGWRK